MLSALRRWAGRLIARIIPPRGAVSAGGGKWLQRRFKFTVNAQLPDQARQLELTYRLYLPSGHQRRGAAPLLVMLHGCQQNSRDFAAGTGMNDLAELHKFVVLYPEQSKTANAYQCWNWYDSAVLRGEGEAQAIVALIAEVMRRRGIDPARIYVAGMSAGGAMARVLAICHGRIFAACAVHSGLMYHAATNAVQAMRAMRDGSRASPEATRKMLWQTGASNAAFVPTLVIHGDQDKVVNPRNAQLIVAQALGMMPPADAAAESIVATETLPADDLDRGYTIRDYSRHGATLLRSISVAGLGHAWSGSKLQLPFNDTLGPGSSELVWQFVSQHRRAP